MEFFFFFKARFNDYCRRPFCSQPAFFNFCGLAGPQSKAIHRNLCQPSFPAIKAEQAF